MKNNYEKFQEKAKEFKNNVEGGQKFKGTK